MAEKFDQVTGLVEHFVRIWYWYVVLAVKLVSVWFDALPLVIGTSVQVVVLINLYRNW